MSRLGGRGETLRDSSDTATLKHTQTGAGEEFSIFSFRRISDLTFVLQCLGVFECAPVHIMCEETNLPEEPLIGRPEHAQHTEL